MVAEIAQNCDRKIDTVPIFSSFQHLLDWWSWLGFILLAVPSRSIPDLSNTRGWLDDEISRPHSVWFCVHREGGEGRRGKKELRERGKSGARSGI